MCKLEVVPVEMQGEQWGLDAVPLAEDKLDTQNQMEGPAGATDCCNHLCLRVE